MRTNRMSRIALVALAALALGACRATADVNVGDDDSEAATEPDAATELELVEEGTLTVCSDIPYPPFEFEDPDAPGEYTGYDIDLMQAVADGLDLTLEVKDTDFTAIETGASLQAGECDVLASSITITEERAEQIDFTQPYFDADQSLLIRADDAETYTSLEDLAGETIGVQAGTTGADYAQENAPAGTEIKEFGEADAMFLALSSGDVEALLQDFPVNAYRATQDPTFTVTETFPTGEEYGFGVKKGNTSLLDAINDQLDALHESGDFDAIFATYFGEPQDDASDAASEDG